MFAIIVTVVRKIGATIIAVIMILARVILVVHTAHAPLVNNRNRKIRIS